MPDQDRVRKFKRIIFDAQFVHAVPPEKVAEVVNDLSGFSPVQPWELKSALMAHAPRSYETVQSEFEQAA